MITLTKSAGDKIKEMMEEQGASPLFLRLGVIPGGCSGFSYSMGFDDEKQEEDKEFDQHGISILVNQTSFPLIQDLEIDYKESGLGGGFTIHNPNATATCGCGSSFRTATEAGQPTTDC